MCFQNQMHLGPPTVASNCTCEADILSSLASSQQPSVVLARTREQFICLVLVDLVFTRLPTCQRLPPPRGLRWWKWWEVLRGKPYRPFRPVKLPDSLLPSVIPLSVFFNSTCSALRVAVSLDSLRWLTCPPVSPSRLRPLWRHKQPSTLGQAVWSCQVA